MPPNTTPFRTIALALLSAGLTSVVFANNGDLKTNSPFLPPNFNKPTEVAPPPPQVNGPIAKQLEFKGLINLGGEYRFSVFNKQDQRSYWLTEGQGQDGISISSFDADAQTVVVNMNGRSEQLTLMSASDAPLPVKASMPHANKTPNRGANTPQRPNILPPGLPTNNSNNTRSKVPPRRRVILPKKN